jgi:hypothetical protein
MARQAFANVMLDVQDWILIGFRSRIRNVAVAAEDFPPGQSSSASGQPIVTSPRGVIRRVVLLCIPRS